MKKNILLEETRLLEKLNQKDFLSFERLYNNYSEDLLIFAYTILEDAPLSLQKVDDLFEGLREGSQFEKVRPPIYAFLCAELRKYCMADR